MYENEIYTQSLLAFASYADLAVGTPTNTALTKAGMSESRSEGSGL